MANNKTGGDRTGKERVGGDRVGGDRVGGDRADLAAPPGAAEWHLNEAVQKLTQGPVTAPTTSGVASAQSHIRQALTHLQECRIGVRPDRELKDGCYAGGNAEYFIELRIDLQGSKTVSADLYFSGQRKSYIASVRTLPGAGPDDSGSWAIAVESPNATAKGTLIVNSFESNHVFGSITVEEKLRGLPVHEYVAFAARWKSAMFRRLSIEVSSEESAEKDRIGLPTALVDDAPVTVSSTLRNSGIEVRLAQTRTLIPPLPPDSGGWSEKAIDSLLGDLEALGPDNSGFSLRLLWLSKSNRPGLLGVMCDSHGKVPLPRRGLAIFAQTIREKFPDRAEAEAKLLQTTLHEVGHGLNLVHRFELGVGRSDSLSAMNYDWCYRGGGQSQEFWHNFKFTFDQDELRFLRHASLRAVKPGGAPFHSIDYWTAGEPEEPTAPLELELLPPQNGVRFGFGQPIILGLRLTNKGDRGLAIPSCLLDQKAGFLQVRVQRPGSKRKSYKERGLFTPLFTRCFNDHEAIVEILEAASTKEENMNLTFGAEGFAFHEPGAYEITAEVSLQDPLSGQNLTTSSDPLQIYVSYPLSDEDENDAAVLYRKDVGRYFALGGGGHLEKASDDLQEVMERRLRRRPSHRNGADPIVANILRCKIFDNTRNYLRLDGDQIRLREANHSAALEHLKGLTDSMLMAFDSITAKATLAHHKKLRQKSI